MKRYVSKSAEHTQKIGEELGAQLSPGTLLILSGDLGAGKTTLCRGIAAGLGSKDPVSSPTFAIVNLYRGPVPFAHFDAWRMEGTDDLETAGFYEYLDQGAVVAVEWGEKIVRDAGIPYTQISLRQLSDAQREIEIEEMAAI